MKIYNRSLDYMTLAMAKGRQGKTVEAAKLFAKAITASDAVRAIAILETSNKQAFEATAKAKTIAKRAVKAAEEEFDMGEDEEVAGLMDEDSDEDEEVEAAVEDEDEEGFDEQFAKVLSGLTASRKAKAKK